MTTHNAAAVSDATIAFQKPITLQQGRALRDNPISSAEGNGGAYIAAGWHPYDGVTVGDAGDGVIYDFAVDGAVASFETPVFLDGYEYKVEWVDVASSSGTPDFSAEFYRATSAAYGAGITLEPTLTASFPVNGEIEIYKPMVVSRMCFFRRFTFQHNTDGVASDPLSTSAIRHTTAQKVSKIRFSVSTSTFGGGKFVMSKRRTFATI